MFTHILPIVIHDPRDLIGVPRIEQGGHHLRQVGFEREGHLDDVLVGRFGVGVEEVVVVLDEGEGVGDDERATLLEVSTGVEV